MKRKAFLALGLAFLVATSPPWAATNLPDLGDASRDALSPIAERRLGEQIMRDLRWRDPAYLDDAEIEGYVNELGRKLVAASPEARQDFEFFAVRDSTLNAFALPGGFVGVHTGLILAAQSESELAGVLAHEIAHVTQHHIARLVGGQSQASLLTIAGLVLAALAARSNSQLSQAAIAASVAGSVQQQLNYTRDFEREADRIGFQILDGAGFDVSGMASFFERLQRFGRVYDNNAPAYLRTHPLTEERIADIENRRQEHRYRQVADSLGFVLVRAKLRANQGTPAEAVADFAEQLRTKSQLSEVAIRYGYAIALARARDFKEAEAHIVRLRALKVASPMIDNLAAELRVGQADPEGAIRLYRQAHVRFPSQRALSYGLAETLIANQRAAEAIDLIGQELLQAPADARLWGMQAKAYSSLGKRTLQHRAQAEVYALQGLLPAAVEQLELGRRAGDADFYEASALDARLRELRQRQLEEAKEQKKR